MSELTPRAMGFYPVTVSSGRPTWSYVSGPTYLGPNGTNLLFPFTLSNGLLELVLRNNFTLSTGVPQMMGATVSLSGSTRKVTSIGPNLRAYIKNCTWDERTIPNASSISVHTPGSMTQVQQLDESFVGRTSSVAYKVTGGAPPSNFALQFPGFGVTFAFLTPLVLKATDNLGRQFYITLLSSWDAT
jgi:hypothetical protein